MVVHLAHNGASFSFFFCGFSSLLTALCFADLASRVPSNGAQYSFMYIFYGEVAAWVSFVMMMFEYLVSASLAAGGFVHSLAFFLKSIGVYFPTSLYALDLYIVTVNPLALMIILVLTYVLLRGIEDSIYVNNIITVVIVCCFMTLTLLVYLIEPDTHVDPPTTFSGTM